MKEQNVGDVETVETVYIHPYPPDGVGGLPMPSLDIPPMQLLLAPGAQAPVRAYPSSAGMDLFTSRTVEVDPDGYMDVPTGVSVAIPVGWMGTIRGRSSTWHQRKLLVFESTIDAEYRGEIFIGVKNFNRGMTHKINKGERIAQLIIERVYVPRIEIVDKLGETERGDKGIGSTGR